MFAEVDVLGAFVPGIAVWLFGALVIFIILDVLLTRVGLYRLFWHPALARVSLFV
jgi:protein AaeX